MAKKKVDPEENQGIDTTDLIIESINKEFDDPIITKMGDSSYAADVPSPFLGLNKILGGGLFRSKMVEMYSEAGVGKSSLSLHFAKEILDAGGKVAYIDAEGGLNGSILSAIGIEEGYLYLCQPDYGEQGLTVLEKLIESNNFDLIIIDSVSALKPKKVIEGEIGEERPGIQAAMYSQALPKIRNKLRKSKAIVIWINQLREKLQMGFAGGGGKDTTGGMALKFYVDVKLQLKKIGLLKHGEKVVGHNVEMMSPKNRYACPYQKCLLKYIYGEGFCKYREVIDLGVEYGIIDKKGSWFAYDDNNLAQGEAGTVEYLKENKEVFDEIRGKIITLL